MSIINYFQVLQIKPKADLCLSELENCYVQMQINYSDKIDYISDINKAWQILKNYITRIEHMFNILDPNNLQLFAYMQQESYQDQSLAIEFFDLNQEIEDQNGDFSMMIDFRTQLEQDLKENLVKLDNLYQDAEYIQAYKIFLRIKYIFRSLNLLNNFF